MQIRAEDDSVGLGKLCVGSTVECRELAGVSPLHPDSCGVVIGIVRALGDPVPHPRHVLAAVQVRQVVLQFRKQLTF